MRIGGGHIEDKESLPIDIAWIGRLCCDKRLKREDSVVESAFGIAVFLFMAGSWLTHVIECINTQAWGFLIAGAIFFPVGIVHGVGLWIGVW